MKLRKILATTVAAAVAVSAMAVTASAATVISNSAIDASCDGVADGVIILKNEDGSINLFDDNGITVDDIYGLQVVLDITADAVNGADWIGGGMGANSESTGWLSTEWGQASGAKPIVLGEDGILTWLSETPVFAATDTYCQLWVQAWGIDVTVKEMNILGKDGSVILGDALGTTEEAPAEEESNEAAGAASADVKFIDGMTPSLTVKVTGDVDKITANVAIAPADGDAYGFNDWCGHGVVVTAEDGTKTFYQWGGAQVSWNVDYDKDGTDDFIGGVNGDNWLGSVSGDSATLEIPVTKGATVEFICQAYDAYDGVQYTITIDSDVEAVAAEEAPAEEEEVEEEAEAEEEVAEEEVEEEEAEEDKPVYEYVDPTFTPATGYMFDGDSNNIVYLRAESDMEPSVERDTGFDPMEVYGMTYYVEFDADEVADPDTWVGGGIGANSNSTGWLQFAWDDPAVVCDFENGTITYLAEEPIFAEDDAYAQVWCAVWGGTVTVNGANILDANGDVIELDLEVAEEVEEEVVEEEEAPVEEAPATGDVDAATDSDKGSPDTGIEDVAVVAGLAIVAAGAVLVSKKRK